MGLAWNRRAKQGHLEKQPCFLERSNLHEWQTQEEGGPREPSPNSQLKAKTNRARPMACGGGCLRASAWLCSLECFSVVSSELDSAHRGLQGKREGKRCQEDMLYRFGRVPVGWSAGSGELFILEEGRTTFPVAHPWF